MFWRSFWRLVAYFSSKFHFYPAQTKQVTEMLFYILQPHPDQPGEDGDDIEVC